MTQNYINKYYSKTHIYYFYLYTILKSDIFHIICIMYLLIDFRISYMRFICTWHINVTIIIMFVYIYKYKV